MTEEVDLYRWLVDHIEHYQTDITLVLPKLLSGKPETKPLFDGSSLKEVCLLFITYYILLLVEKIMLQLPMFIFKYQNYVFYQKGICC